MGRCRRNTANVGDAVTESTGLAIGDGVTIFGARPHATGLSTQVVRLGLGATWLGPNLRCKAQAQEVLTIRRVQGDKKHVQMSPNEGQRGLTMAQAKARVSLRLRLGSHSPCIPHQD